MKRRYPRILAISDMQSLSSGDLASWAATVAGAGVDGVQLREKRLTALAQLETAVRLRTAAPETLLLINRRLDLALAAGADGVHLPADGVPVRRLRESFGGDPILGCSTHHLDEVAQAAEEGADYVLFGPVFATPSKARYGQPQGLQRLADAVGYRLPVLAIGGVTAKTVPEVAATGVAGIAGIRAFLDREQTAAIVRAANEYIPPRDSNV